MQELVLDSRYVVCVRLMGPFAFDHIEQVYHDPPPVMRQITMATGDVVPWPYTPEADRPPPHHKDDPEEFELWARYKSRQYACTDLLYKSQRARAHFFLLEAIEVIRGPYPNIVNWVFRRFKMWRRLFCRSSDGFFFEKRYLQWLKTNVIASQADWQKVQQAATALEVDMDGILDAARRFQRILGQDGPAGGPGVAAQRERAVQHARVGSAGSPEGG